MDGVMYKQFDKEVKVVVVVMNGVMDKQVENEVEKEVNKVVFLATAYLTENFKIETTAIFVDVDLNIT